MPKPSLPSNSEAEEALLGAILTDARYLPAARKVVEATDFYYARYQSIFAEIVALADAGQAIDLITLAARLEALPGSTEGRSYFDDLGREFGLLNLMERCATPSNATHYAGIIKDCSLRRLGMHLAREAYLALKNDADGLNKLQASNGHYHLSERLAVHTDPEPICVADVGYEALSYLWKPWLIVGKFHVWSGDPGIFKSGVSLTLAARITTGKPMPLCHEALCEPSNVLILAAEDGIADTIKVRFIAAGGDESRLFVFTPKELGDLSDIAMLRRIIKKYKVKLVIFDPLASFIPDAVERRGKIALRQDLLAPLTALAESTKCAIIALAHLNKGSAGGNALYRSAGFLDYVAVARVTVLLTKHPKEDDVYLFVASKMNLAKAPQSIVYHIEQTEEEIPFVRFDGVTDEWNSGNVLYELPETPAQKQGSKDAKEWILEHLQDGCWHQATAIEKEIKDDLGISQATYQRARDDLRKAQKITRKAKSAMKEASYWCLTGTADVPAPEVLPLGGKPEDRPGIDGFFEKEEDPFENPEEEE